LAVNCRHSPPMAAAAATAAAGAAAAGAAARKFDVVSVRSPVIKELVRLRLGRRRVRSQKGVALVRGRQLIQNLGQHFKFESIYTHEPHDAWAEYNAKRIYRVEKEVLRHALFANRAAEAARRDADYLVVGTINQPAPVAAFEPAPRMLLAVDGVRQPENMGLLLSTAVALRFDGVVFSADCVDPFHYKVLEASQAVAWTMPYMYASTSELLAWCRQHRLKTCAADASGTPVSELPMLQQDLRGFCLAVGSETRGVQPEYLQGSARVALPMSHLSDSLNAGVAGGVLMHALTCAWGR